MSTLDVAAGAIRRDETVEVVLLLALAGGIVIAAWLRRIAGDRAGALSVLLEVIFLIVIGILHNRLPDTAGTLGISMVAAIQTAIFVKVEGTVCSTVMITGNMRQMVENMFSVVYGGARPGTLRKSAIFYALCAVFGCGAAVGAFATKAIPNPALGIPAIALLIVLLLCEIAPREVVK